MTPSAGRLQSVAGQSSQLRRGPKKGFFDGPCVSGGSLCGATYPFRLWCCIVPVLPTRADFSAWLLSTADSVDDFCHRVPLPSQFLAIKAADVEDNTLAAAVATLVHWLTFPCSTQFGFLAVLGSLCGRARGCHRVPLRHHMAWNCFV
ncbi:uncharacterized protein [Dermacentor albipictus]|uniref:uncharacterized protein n=1 Tax=Dermacentor albipictus TaxID=60249 RepID=UPI0038FC64C2